MKKLEHGWTHSLGFVLREGSTEPFREVLTQPSFESRHLQAESIVTIYKLMVAPGQRPHKHVTSISRSAPAVFRGRMNDDQVPRKCGYFT